MERFFVILLSLGLFFALSLVACIPVLHLTLPRAAESHPEQPKDVNLSHGELQQITRYSSCILKVWEMKNIIVK